MAGANSKRIASANAQQLTILRLGTAVSSVIYLLHLLVFQSGRTKWRLFLFVSTLTSELSLWQQLEGMAQRGQSLEGKGLVQYMFDLVYITWFVHVTTALVSAKFWYLFWIVPGYGIYKILNLFFPTLFSSTPLASSNSDRTSAASTSGTRPRSAAEAQSGVTAEILSKRQEKLKKRVDKGDPRAIAKTQQQQMLQDKIEKQKEKARQKQT
ncbi:uncharacterized protein JCM15063_004388 [Sporobolomyces koalae]|uniref:uncharacterized protein n=1 Tax=Sporobolomyces koalae TaxID=500713 RepID=UPI003181A341